MDLYGVPGSLGNPGDFTFAPRSEAKSEAEVAVAKQDVGKLRTLFDEAHKEYTKKAGSMLQTYQKYGAELQKLVEAQNSMTKFNSAAVIKTNRLVSKALAELHHQLKGLRDIGFEKDIRQPLLVTAAEGGHISVVRFLGEMLDCNCSDGLTGQTPLMKAVLSPEPKKNLQVVRYLIERKANANILDNNGYNALFYSAMVGDTSIEITRTLLAKSPATVGRGMDRVPLLSALLDRISTTGQARREEKWMNTVRLISQPHVSSEGVLSVALTTAASKNLAMIGRCLLETKRLTVSDFKTAWMVASKPVLNCKFLSMLIHSNVIGVDDVKFGPHSNRTLLQEIAGSKENLFADSTSFSELLRNLLEAKADISRVDDHGKSLFYLGIGFNVLGCMIIAHGSCFDIFGLNEVAEQVLQFGCLASIRCLFETKPHLKAIYAKTDIVAARLNLASSIIPRGTEEYATFGAPRNHLTSPARGEFEVLSYLIRDCNFDVNIPDSKLRTPVTITVVHLLSRTEAGQRKMLSSEVIEMLLEAKADVTLRDESGKRAYEYFEEALDVRRPLHPATVLHPWVFLMV